MNSGTKSVPSGRVGRISGEMIHHHHELVKISVANPIPEFGFLVPRCHRIHFHTLIQILVLQLLFRVSLSVNVDPLWLGLLQAQGLVDQGKIELGPWAAELNGGLVVGPGRFLRGVEGTKPYAGGTARVADLGGPFPPGPLPDAAVLLLGPLLLLLLLGEKVAPEAPRDVALATRVHARRRHQTRRPG
ncbi:hypothetical protein Fmac_006103 [Flemingia macrophylla]|uniref:Uncharacterized protein n=1 Tax=Flemingia macrophylla TaxID=520843 RepID=A0ABD1N9N3_9FABA